MNRVTSFGNEQRRVLRALRAGERLHFRPDLAPHVSPARVSHGGGKWWTTVARCRCWIVASSSTTATAGGLWKGWCLMSYEDMARDVGLSGAEAAEYARMLEDEDIRQSELHYRERVAAQWAAANIAPFIDPAGKSLYGTCGMCDRRVDNYDPGHRVTSIVHGGAGVECVTRGDITVDGAAPLARVGYRP